MRNLFAGMALAATLFATSAHADVTLTISNWLAPTHPLRTDALDVWTRNIEVATEGRVKFRTLPKAIGATGAQVDVVSQGLADVGFIAHGYAPGRFVLQEVAELPFLGNRGADVSPAYWRVFDKVLRKYNEHEGVVVLSVMTASAGQLHNTRVDVKSVSDIAGMKIRVPGGATTEIVKLLGAVPILKPVNETYELLSTGVVDGTLFALASVKANNMLDLLKHTTNIPGGLYNASYSLFVNPDKWNAIDEADRARIMAESGEKFAALWGSVLDKQDIAAEEAAKATGNTILTADPAMVDDVKARLSGVEDTWIAAAKAKGLDNAADVLTSLRKEIADNELADKK